MAEEVGAVLVVGDAAGGEDDELPLRVSVGVAASVVLVGLVFVAAVLVVSAAGVP